MKPREDPKNDEERYERWLSMFKVLGQANAAQLMQQQVQENGPAPDYMARAFRDALGESS